ncbi:MAG: ribonuclease P protein component [Deltaproteobacteria bacterium]|nr:ribonuclease P protein component [Deltaproteobacteria bacterium]
MKDRYVFPATNRLRCSKEYQDVWARGTRHHTAHFIILICPNNTDLNRLGITVSRKVGNAVCRNQIKRWLREYFRLHLRDLKVCLDISIVAKRTASKAKHSDLVQELNSVFARLETDDHV